MLPKAISCALIAVVATSGLGLASFDASAASSAPSAWPDRAQGIAAEQSRSVAAGRALGLGSGEKLVVKDVITDADGSTHVRYDRTFNGLRVIGGDLVTHPGRAGRLTSVSWNSSHRVAVASTTPKISLARALAAGATKASSARRTASSAGRGELVVFNGGATPRLAYDVLTVGVQADQTPSRLHTIVDASTGITLQAWDDIETGTGNSIYAGSVPIGTTAGVGFAMRDAVGNSTTDLNGLTGTLLGTIFADADDVWGNGAVSDRASAGVDAHYGAGKTFDFYKNVLGRNGIWNTGVGVRSRVHYGTNYVNAFWDGSQMTYGDGAGNTHPLVELDVAGHEMSHGVTQATAGLVYTGDAGGLNEANSDIFGTAVEWYTNNASDNPDYLIGEKIDINGNGTPLRYMDKPSRDGGSKDCWSSTLGGLDPHYSSGPLNHWFYLASEGSGAKTINGVSYNSPTCNASTVTPIGRDKAEKIWYRTLSTYLTSNSNYAAAREGAIRSAKDLYGASSPECAGIASSFSAIAVPAGAETCVATPPPPPPPAGSNALLNPGFESGADSWAASLNVIAQNPANQPTRSGSWNAWLDGYGLSHTDSVSQSLTIPADSPAFLSYFVHIDTGESGSTSNDTMTVRAGSTVLQTLSNLNAVSGYQLKTVDLSGYAGQTISLSFTGVENGSLQTSFVIDDTAVTATLPSTPPAVPTGVKATPGNARAAVSWTAPASNGGSLITGYTATASPGGRTATTTGAVAATVTGLTNGTSYTFRVSATNAIGTSPGSAPSAAVTPRVPLPKKVFSPLDFTGDGRSDVLRVTPTGDLLLYRGSGSGGLGAPTRIGTGWGGFLRVFSPGDFTGDKRADLLAISSTGDLYLYRGNGLGGFAGARTRIGAGWGGFINLFSPGDFTGDHRADVLAVSSAGDLYLYRGNGIGGFAGARTRIGGGWQSMRVMFSPRDFTGDGRSDVMGVSRSAGDLYLYAGNGIGGLRSGVRIGVGWGDLSATFSPRDFTGDGRSDVMGVEPSGDLYLYRGNGNGGWLGARQKVAAGLS